MAASLIYIGYSHIPSKHCIVFIFRKETLQYQGHFVYSLEISIYSLYIKIDVG